MEVNKLNQIITNMGKDKNSVTPKGSKQYDDRKQEIEKFVVNVKIKNK